MMVKCECGSCSYEVDEDSKRKRKELSEEADNIEVELLQTRLATSPE